MKNRLRQDGFTLVEVVVALFVLVTGMLGAMGMQYMAVHGNAVSRQMRIATNMGQDLVEQVMSMPYDALASGVFNPTGVFDPDSSTYNSSTTGGVDYTRVVWVFPSCSRIDPVSVNTPVGVDPCDGAAAGALAGAIVSVCDNGPPVSYVRPTNDATAVVVRTCWTDKYNKFHAVSFPTAIWN